MTLSGKPGRLPRYKCATRRILPPDQRHPPVSVTAPKADEPLWRAVVALLADGTLLELVAHLRAAARHSGVQSRQQGLLRMVADGEARLAENLGLYHRGLLTEQVLERENRGLTVEVERARAELEAGREQLEAGARAASLTRTAGARPGLCTKRSAPTPKGRARRIATCYPCRPSGAEWATSSAPRRR